MLYGENNISLEAAKKWTQSLSLDSVRLDDDPVIDESLRTIFLTQLDAFKELISNATSMEDWDKALHVISLGLMRVLFVSSKGAIRVGNYYECFVTPSDTRTSKKIFEGLAECYEVGDVRLFDGEKQIGSIGQKSDLIWSMFYEYFIVDHQHTLDSHEKFLTLQLWNVGEKTESEILEYINAVLFHISFELGLNFARSYPDESWKEHGCAGIYNVQVSREAFEPIPLVYLNYGLTCQDPRIAYLHCYQVLEYFFVRAQNKELLSNLANAGLGAGAAIKDSELRGILKKYSNSQREIEALKLVLAGAVNVDDLQTFILALPERVYQYTEDTSISNKILISLSANDDKIIGKMAERIYFFRCAIAHAKGDVDEFLALPDISDSLISAELPLLKNIAKKALDAWGH